ncbi:MAG TPA: hypothetical protein RMH85_17710 [Polyangiaceae bacterium LLY-WYZ-15_(1-7)]|nr:hypothetical protein [Myxococcales bacterium]MAT27711.1 hypothetical protein [Sandaracinus sp.]HJK99969.1 hypothetical protein [Polyangiaceae bacterium LLY-WYZ-15_(1-7)]MBJ73573.1 hypothetical protein [Sandaracinus sp.]HJL10341.1 hypothetical protein [Polyangiaceae bacterium LLY-WYZ-15_(1-7)]
MRKVGIVHVIAVAVLLGSLGAARAAAQPVPVRFEGGPGTTLHAATELDRHERGISIHFANGHVAHSETGGGDAWRYRPICEMPCTPSLPPDVYRLALSDDRGFLEAGEAVIGGPLRVRVWRRSRRWVRLLGLVFGIIGPAFSAALAAAQRDRFDPLTAFALGLPFLVVGPILAGVPDVGQHWVLGPLDDAP